jgi:hypothetical protein
LTSRAFSVDYIKENWGESTWEKQPIKHSKYYGKKIRHAFLKSGEEIEFSNPYGRLVAGCQCITGQVTDGDTLSISIDRVDSIEYKDTKILLTALAIMVPSAIIAIFIAFSASFDDMP